MSLPLSRRVCPGLMLVLAGSSIVSPAQRPSAVTLPAAPTLARLTRNSAYIFSGTVLAVERVPADSGNSVASVQVTFRVDQGILGVRTGQTLSVREWAGLWESGERYRPGERLVLFLHRPSRLGLTSAVGGSLGRFDVDSSGSVVLDPRLLDPSVLDPSMVHPIVIHPVVVHPIVVHPIMVGPRQTSVIGEGRAKNSADRRKNSN